MPQYQPNASRRTGGQPPTYDERTQSQSSSRNTFPANLCGKSVNYAPAPTGESTGLLSGQQSYGAIHVHHHKPDGVTLKLKSKALYGIIGFLVAVSAIFGYCVNETINELSHSFIRQRWNVEVSNHEKLRSRMHIEREEFMEESRGWARERSQRAEEENRRKELEKQQRDTIAWSHLGPSSHCLTYGTREYTATLTNVPLGFNAIEECWNKPVEIHGKLWHPTSCEDEGVCGRVTGHWKVNFNEGGCTPWWSYFKDKGCVDHSGTRRYEAPLENFQRDGNWQEMCSTTPATINGVYHDGPTSCVDWGKYSIWGIWFVDDNNCW